MKETLLQHTEARFAHDLFHQPLKFRAIRTCINLLPPKQAAKSLQQVSPTPTPVSAAEAASFYYVLFVLQKQESDTIWGRFLCELGRW